MNETACLCVGGGLFVYVCMTANTSQKKILLEALFSLELSYKKEYIEKYYGINDRSIPSRKKDRSSHFL